MIYKFIYLACTKSKQGNLASHQYGLLLTWNLTTNWGTKDQIIKTAGLYPRFPDWSYISSRFIASVFFPHIVARVKNLGKNLVDLLLLLIIQKR